MSWRGKQKSKRVLCWVLVGKLDPENKKALLDAIKEATKWIESEGRSAYASDLEEKLQEIYNIINRIKAKLYTDFSTSSDSTDDNG